MLLVALSHFTLDLFCSVRAASGYNKFVDFEWDDGKAAENKNKHGISFFEAATVFDDPLGVTTYDPDHSNLARPVLEVCCWWFSRSAIARTELSAHGKRPARKNEFLRKVSDMQLEPKDDLRPEYDEETLRAMLKTGVRGKSVNKYREGTNLVKLAPDIAAAFPTEKAVNDALRSLLAQNATGFAKV